MGQKVKANWKTKGFKYKVKDGELKGKIRPTWPLRIAMALNRYFWLNVVYIGVIGIFAYSVWGDSETLDTTLGMGWMIILVGGIPYFLLNGKRIAITPTHCTIGGKRYALADMTKFTAVKIPYAKQDQYFIEFRYGKDRKTIKVRNSFEHQLDVIRTLNMEVERLINPAPASPADVMMARSATF